LETAAPAGGILVSRTVHEAVTGRLKATFTDLGSLALKNIERPVQAFSVKWEPSDWRRPSSLSLESSYEQRQPSSVEQLALPDKPSIAVLPFQNMSGDPEQEYFADGIVEDIITALSRFKSLFVIARSSSFATKVCHGHQWRGDFFTWQGYETGTQRDGHYEGRLRGFHALSRRIVGSFSGLS
jgi:adenylate cyclase